MSATDRKLWIKDGRITREKNCRRRKGHSGGNWRGERKHDVERE